MVNAMDGEKVVRQVLCVIAFGKGDIGKKKSEDAVRAQRFQSANVTSVIKDNLLINELL
jgi:hypothetical protein